MSDKKLVLLCFFRDLSYHESLNHNAINALEAHYENGFGALFGSPNVDGGEVKGERERKREIA